MTENTKKTALITGASRGLGLALARQLAGMGWSLIIDARGAETLEKARAELAALTHVIAIPGDITESSHRAELAKAVDFLGGLDALINNASTLGISPRPNLLDYPLDALEAVYRANVIAPLGLIQALRHDLKANARILNVTSDAGVEPYEGWGGYGSSKAAFEHLSAILANENPAWRVYWVDPGDMRTQMHQEAFPGEDISDRELPEESVPGVVTLLTGDLPSGRYQAKKIGQQHDESKPVQGMRLVLVVPDFDKAVDFYRDGLGLPVLDQWISPESNKGILLSAGNATIELLDHAQAEEIDQIEMGKPSAAQIRLAFTVDEVNTASKALQKRGAVLLSEAILTPWGHLNQRLKAPDAIHKDIELTLSQVVAKEGETSS